MIALESYIAFVAATSILIAIPGPNVALIVANSVAYGPRHGLVTVAGTSTAMVVQLAIAVAGLSGALALFAGAFEYLRWLGVGYLIYLGVNAWRAAEADLSSVEAEGVPWHTMFARGFLVSLTNPKTLIFYAAFLPQFVADGSDRTGQLMVLAATFLAIAVALDSAWALLAARARPLLHSRARIRNRVTGGLLISAAAGLALARKS